MLFGQNLRLLQAQLAPDGGTPSSRASGGSLLTTTQHTDTSALRQRLSRLQSQLTALEEAQLAAEQAAQHQQAASTPAATPAVSLMVTSCFGCAQWVVVAQVCAVCFFFFSPSGRTMDLSVQRTAGSRRAPSKTPAKQSEESLATLRSRLLGEVRRKKIIFSAKRLSRFEITETLFLMRNQDDETQQSALSDERQQVCSSLNYISKLRALISLCMLLFSWLLIEQELLTDDMLHLARNMKENAKQSQQMLQEGNEVSPW